MGRLRTSDEIQVQIDKLFGSSLILLDKNTYVNTHVKARFVDKDFGEWWTSPLSVLHGQGNPKRGHVNGGNLHRISLQDIQKKLIELFHSLVIIDPTTYI